jgi:hypothetical protein
MFLLPELVVADVVVAVVDVFSSPHSTSVQNAFRTVADVRVMLVPFWKCFVLRDTAL